MSGCADALDDALTPFDRIVKENDERVEDSPAVLAAVMELELELNLELRRRPSTPTNIPLEYQLRSPSRPEYQHPPAAQLDTSVFYSHKNLNIEEISSCSIDSARTPERRHRPQNVFRRLISPVPSSCTCVGSSSPL
jgi:hypothetical protein